MSILGVAVVSALRDYQAEAVDKLYEGWAGGKRRLGVSLPTGVGKTHIMAHLGKREASRDAERTLFLVHRDTLVEQTLAKLRATLDPHTSIGVVKAQRNELGAQIIVASVHSLRTAKRRAMLPPIGLCVVDEAHVSVSNTYRAVFDQIGAMRQDGARLAGFTATWSRSDSTGLGDVWQDVVYHKTIKWATNRGHLVRPRGIWVGDGSDTSGVRVNASGEYSDADLERVVMLESIREAVVRGVLRHGGNRPGVLFAPTVASARYFASALEEAGVSTGEYFGETGVTERYLTDSGLRSGKVRMAVTCTAIAEGYDNPQLSLGVLCRPTKHEGLFVQMIGRLLRPWPGKQDALLLDCVGATKDVQLRNAIDLSLTRETVLGEELPPDELEDPDEPVGRDRVAKVRRTDTEVELFAGTQVQWLTSQVGVPFVSCGNTLVFLVEGKGGTWNVGQCGNRLDPQTGRPGGGWVAEGLSQEDALTLASDHAENEGEHISRRSAAWRGGKPSEAQINTAHMVGLVVADGMTRGQVSDSLSIAFAGRVLAPFAQWSAQWRVFEHAV